MSGNNPENPENVEEYFPIDEVPIRIDRNSIKVRTPLRDEDRVPDSYGGRTAQGTSTFNADIKANNSKLGTIRAEQNERYRRGDDGRDIDGRLELGKNTPETEWRNIYITITKNTIINEIQFSKDVVYTLSRSDFNRLLKEVGFIVVEDEETKTLASEGGFPWGWLLLILIILLAIGALFVVGESRHKKGKRRFRPGKKYKKI